jgi:hypothetical protein
MLGVVSLLWIHAPFCYRERKVKYFHQDLGRISPGFLVEGSESLDGQLNRDRMEWSCAVKVLWELHKPA